MAEGEESVYSRERPEAADETLVGDIVDQVLDMLARRGTLEEGLPSDATEVNQATTGGKQVAYQ